MERCGVPLRFRTELQRPGFTHETRSILEVERWRSNKDNLILVLCGRNQKGKSYACAYGLSLGSKILKSQFGEEPWLEYRYVDSDFSWIMANELASLKDRFDPEVRSRQRQIETCATLVVDDVGQAGLVDVAKILESILIKRWSMNRRTMITTNLSSGDGSLQKELGERIVERIRQVGTVVEVD